MVFGVEKKLAVGERRKGLGDVFWLLEEKNGIGGGGEGFAGANRESAARCDRAVTVLCSSSSAPKFSIQVVAFRAHRPSSPLAHPAFAA